MDSKKRKFDGHDRFWIAKRLPTLRHQFSDKELIKGLIPLVPLGWFRDENEEMVWKLFGIRGKRSLGEDTEMVKSPILQATRKVRLEAKLYITSLLENTA